MTSSLNTHRASIPALTCGSQGFDTPLEDIVWTPEAVRLELQRMLLSGTPPLSPLDLMLAHDKSDDCMLNRSEFVVMFKKLVGSEKVWGAAHGTVHAPCHCASTHCLHSALSTQCAQHLLHAALCTQHSALSTHCRAHPARVLTGLGFHQRQRDDHEALRAYLWRGRRGLD